MLRRFLVQSWLYFKGRHAASDLQEFVFLQTVYPLLTLIFYCMIASYCLRTFNITRCVVGNSFLICINTCIFGVGMGFTGERINGRIRYIVASPVSKLLITLESGFYTSFIAMIMSLFGFFAGGLIFDLDLSEFNIGMFFLITFTAMFSATGFGLLLSVFGLLTDSMQFVLNVVSYILIILCGANFPINQLPIVAQFFSKLLPLTRSIEAASNLFGDYNKKNIFELLISEILLGIIYVLISIIIIKKVEKLAILKATLDIF